MKRASRAFFVACAALIGFVLAYALPVYARLPRTFYDPVARRWQWASNLGPIPMGYVGQIVWGIAGALICGGLAGLITSRFKREPSERAFSLWTAWALTALAIVLGYFTWNNWP
ncbi:MAG TPA: hypothetical protein VII38_07555 [Polyangia bacterium]